MLLFLQEKKKIIVAKKINKKRKPFSGLSIFHSAIIEFWFLPVDIMFCLFVFSSNRALYQSYCTGHEIWRALKKLELLSTAPLATRTLLSCSPNFPRAPITRYTSAKHGPIL